MKPKFSRDKQFWLFLITTITEFEVRRERSYIVFLESGGECGYYNKRSV